MNNKIDYGKIVFIGVPLVFIAWVVIFISILFMSGGSESTLFLSFLLTGVFAVIYFFVTIRFANKVGAIIVEPAPDDPKANLKKPMSKPQVIYAALLVILLFASLATVTIFYNIPTEKAFRYIAPFFAILVFAEKLYRKRKTHNKKMKADD